MRRNNFVRFARRGGFALCCALGGIVAVATHPLSAQTATQGTAAMAQPAPNDGEGGLLRRAELSARLFQMAVQDRDPLLALAAAKLRKNVFGAEIVRVPERGSGAAEDRAAAQSPAIMSESPAAQPVGWQDMIETAIAFAPNDPTIKGLADDLSADRAKGVVSGKVYSISQIRAGGKDTYRPLEYQGNAYAEVYVEGSTATDLNVKVFDSAGRLVCSDTDISSIAYCGWRPATTEAFSVVVLNQGGRSTSYTLITN